MRKFLIDKQTFNSIPWKLKKKYYQIQHTKILNYVITSERRQQLRTSGTSEVLINEKTFTNGPRKLQKNISVNSEHGYFESDYDLSITQLKIKTDS